MGMKIKSSYIAPLRNSLIVSNNFLSLTAMNEIFEHRDMLLDRTKIVYKTKFGNVPKD